MAAPVEVTGVDAAQAAYQGIASDAHDMTEPNRAIAEAGARAAQGRAPVATGRLRASIASDATPQDAILEVGVPYWPYVEYGTKYVQGARMMRAGIDAMERAAQPAYEQRMAAIIAKRT
jgi:hypothetical protein